MARALYRALGVPLGSVIVGPYNMDCEAWQADGSVESLLPHKVTRALNRFDRTRTTQPLTFQVQLQPRRGAEGTLGPATLHGMTPLSGGGIVLGTAWLAMRQQAQQPRARAAEMCQRAAEEQTRTTQLQATRCRLEAPVHLMAWMV